MIVEAQMQTTGKIHYQHVLETKFSCLKPGVNQVLDMY